MQNPDLTIIEHMIFRQVKVSNQFFELFSIFFVILTFLRIVCYNLLKKR